MEQEAKLAQIREERRQAGYYESIAAQAEHDRRAAAAGAELSTIATRLTVAPFLALGLDEPREPRSEVVTHENLKSSVEARTEDLSATAEAEHLEMLRRGTGGATVRAAMRYQAERV